MKQLEYTEGPKALENFEKMATSIFQAPKADGRKTRKKASKKASERKPKNVDGDVAQPDTLDLLNKYRTAVSRLNPRASDDDGLLNTLAALSGAQVKPEPRPFIRALAKAMADPQGKAAPDERAEFEKWARTLGNTDFSREPKAPGIYADALCQCSWDGWQARAALAEGTQKEK